MDNNPWSERNIRPGTTYTDKRDFADLNARVKTRRNYFHPLKKSGSQLEVYGKNQHVIINEISTESASIWYGLYDGTLLNVLKDEGKKSKINELLQKYFVPSGFPVIPILRRDENSDPKYRIKDEKTRVYSMHGGANLRTFLGNTSNSDLYREGRFLDTFPTLVGELHNKGISIPWEVPQNASSLELCDFYLKAQLIAKEKLALMPDADEETRRRVIELEIYTKLYTTLNILNELGVIHGHPHGGNIVVSWSRDALSQAELERQLVDPSKINTDFPEMIKTYPDCYIYPLLIDFDQAMFDPLGAENRYDELKLLKLLNSSNKMHKVLALHLLPLEKWPKDFILSLTKSNIGLVDEVSLKLRSLFFDEAANPQVIRSLFTPFLESGVDINGKELKRLLSEIIPGRIPSSHNIVGWKNWITFFRENPSFSDLKQALIEGAMEQSSFIDKEDFIGSVENLLNDSWLNTIRYNIRRVFG